MVTEIEKRIEDAAWHFEGETNVGRDCYNCNGYSDGLTEGFKAGAKFILEMPELREAVENYEGINVRLEKAVEALKVISQYTSAYSGASSPEANLAKKTLRELWVE